MSAKLKSIGGHATAHDKKVVVQMLMNDWRAANTPRKQYEMTSKEEGLITVKVTSKEPDWFGPKTVVSRLVFKI